MLQNRKLFDVAQTEEEALVFNMKRFALIFSIKASLLGIGSLLDLLHAGVNWLGDVSWFLEWWCHFKGGGCPGASLDTNQPTHFVIKKVPHLLLEDTPMSPPAKNTDRSRSRNR